MHQPRLGLYDGGAHSVRVCEFSLWGRGRLASVDSFLSTFVCLITILTRTMDFDQSKRVEIYSVGDMIVGNSRGQALAMHLHVYHVVQAPRLASHVHRR